jgi:hypothetical protein
MRRKNTTEPFFEKKSRTLPYTPPAEGNCYLPSKRGTAGVSLSLLKQMRKQLIITVALALLIFLGGKDQRWSAQTVQPAKLNRTTLSNGNILLNGQPFPMVLDAGTDTFTPQDYNIVMGNKDGFGANTWWLQYAMRHMKSETEGDFSGLGGP